MSYDEYASKVVAYLDPGHAPAFAGRAAWTAMRAGEIESLEAVR